MTHAKKFRKLLIANRGEIAVRVLRACRELDIQTVAIYSECDRLSPHVLWADEAHCVGPSPAGESYLKMDEILSIAKRRGVDAIHPGYGFLSENSDFSDACRSKDIAFIGPKGESMRALGDKIRQMTRQHCCCRRRVTRFHQRVGKAGAGETDETEAQTGIAAGTAG